MRIAHFFLSFLLLAQAAQAQTHYERLEVGTVVEGGIGLGVFSKPYPLPPGQWTLVGRNVKDIPLINSRTKEPSGSISKYDLTLRNTEPASMLPLMVVSITGRLTNLDAGVRPCNPSVNKNQWTDDFPDRPASERSSVGSFVCATSVGVSNFKKFVGDAAMGNNAWAKAMLSSAAPNASTLPDNAVLVNISATRYRGQTIDTVYFVKQEGNLADPAYASHLKPWVHATGQSLLAVVDNNTSTVNLPSPFPGAVGSLPVAIDNRVPSVVVEATSMDAIRIQRSFDLLEVRPDNFRAVLLNCIPQLGASIHTFDFPPENVTNASYKISGSPRVFVLKKSVGVCLKISTANFPIFAADAFLETTKPLGVSDEIVAQWNTKIADLIARQGSAQVAYQFSNLSATVVRFWIDPTAPLVIHYASQFKLKGEWEQQRLDATFANAGLMTVDAIKVNAKGEGKKDLPF
jgi:hypothetical protein